MNTSIHDKYRMREVQHNRIGVNGDPWLNDEKSLGARLKSQEDDLEDRVRASVRPWGGLEILTENQKIGNYDDIVAGRKDTSEPRESDEPKGINQGDMANARDQLRYKLAACEAQAQARVQKSTQNDDGLWESDLVERVPTRLKLTLLDRDFAEQEDLVRRSCEEVGQLQSQHEVESITAQMALDTAAADAHAAFEVARAAQLEAERMQARLEQLKEECATMEAQFSVAIKEAQKDGVAAEVKLEKVFEERERVRQEADAERLGPYNTGDDEDLFYLQNEAAIRVDLHMQARMARDMAWGAPGQHGTAN